MSEQDERPIRTIAVTLKGSEIVTTEREVETETVVDVPVCERCLKSPADRHIADAAGDWAAGGRAIGGYFCKPCLRQILILNFMTEPGLKFEPGESKMEYLRTVDQIVSAMIEGRECNPKGRCYTVSNDFAQLEELRKALEAESK